MLPKEPSGAGVPARLPAEPEIPYFHLPAEADVPARPTRFLARGPSFAAIHRAGKLGQALRASLFAVFATFAIACPATAADFSVGFVGDLSGVGANVAQDQLAGFKLGIKHLGGRIGGYEFNFAVADGRHDAKAARQAAERMLQGEHVAFLLASVDPAGLRALLPLAPAGKTLLVSLASPPASLAGRDCNPSLFSLAGLVDTTNEQAGLYLQSQGFKAVAVERPVGPSADAAVQAFRRGFKGQVIEVTSRRGEMNFANDLKKIGKAEPDAVYLLLTGGMAVNFIRQSAEILGKDRFLLYGPSGTVDQSVLAASGPSALDIGSVGPWSEDLDNPSNRRMQADFEADYGRPASGFAAVGYDAAMLLDAALRTVDKKNMGEDALRNALRHADFPSTRGALRFDSNQFPIQSYLVRQVILDSRDHMVNEQHGIFQKDVRDGHAGDCPIRWPAEAAPKDLERNNRSKS